MFKKNNDQNKILPCFDCVRYVSLVQTRNRWGAAELSPSKFVIIIQVIQTFQENCKLN